MGAATLAKQAVPQTVSKKDWPLNAAAFQLLLDWLDGAVGSEGRRYLLVRERLVAYFDRKGQRAADDLADEVLNRVARRLEEEGGKITTEAPAKYCYTVARFVFMEHLREARQAQHAVDNTPLYRDYEQRLINEAAAEQEFRHKCLDVCLEKLDSRDREIVVSYYVGEQRTKIENRRHLAASLGITSNALSIRACRIRDKLEKCVRQCVGKH